MQSSVEVMKQKNSDLGEKKTCVYVGPIASFNGCHVEHGEQKTKNLFLLFQTQLSGQVFSPSPPADPAAAVLSTLP